MAGKWLKRKLKFNSWLLGAFINLPGYYLRIGVNFCQTGRCLRSVSLKTVSFTYSVIGPDNP